MRRAKSLVFVAVLAVLVFGLVAVASAATFSDAGKYAEPVTALNVLGIVDGYPDGTIKPDQPITRAEFAKILVKELGLSADVAPANTMFSDVPSDHWASGLINVAVGQGLVKGYPDGTFKPDANVTYAEAITMIVRMLGYGPAMDESAWPAPYLAKAATIGVTDGVKVKANEPAIRGDVFTMAYNALDADVMKQTGWGTDIVFEESKDFEDTILYDKLDVDRVGDEDYPVRVVSTPRVNSNLDKDQIEVEAQSDKAKDLYGAEDGVLDIAAGVSIDPNAYLGQEVEVWLNDDDEIIFIRSHTRANDIVKGVVDDFETKAGYDKDSASSINPGTDQVKKLKLADGKEYEFADDVVAYIAAAPVTNPKGFVNRAVDGEDLYVSDFLGRPVTIVLDDGKIAYIEVPAKGDAVIVESVNVADKKIKYYYDSETKRTLDLSDNDDYIILRDGKPATLADIKPGDTLRTAPNILSSTVDEDDIRFIQVTSTKIEGTVEEVGSESSKVQDYWLVVDGKTYKLGGNCYENNYYFATTLTTYSDDNNDTIDPLLNDDSDSIDKLEDLVGKKVTLYMFGSDVRHIVTSEEADSSKDIYAVLPANKAEFNTFEGLRFKVVNKNGDEVTYYATDDTSYYDETPNNSILGSCPGFSDGIDDYDYDAAKQAVADALANQDLLVKIVLDSSGDVDEFHVLVDLSQQPSTVIADEDSDRVKVGGKWYTLDDNAALYEYDGEDYDDASWKAMQDTEEFDGFVYCDDDEVKAIVAYETITTEADRGIVVAKNKTSDGYKLTILVNGQKVAYETDGDNVADGTFTRDNRGTYDANGRSVSYINKGDVVEFDLNGSGKIDTISELVPYGETVSGDTYYCFKVTDVDTRGWTIKVIAVDANEVEKGSEISLALSNDSDPDDKSYVFDYTDTSKAPELVEIGDISEDDIVQVFMFRNDHDNAGQVQLVKIID